MLGRRGYLEKWSAWTPSVKESLLKANNYFGSTANRFFLLLLLNQWFVAVKLLFKYIKQKIRLSVSTRPCERVLKVLSSRNVEHLTKYGKGLCHRKESWWLWSKRLGHWNLSQHADQSWDLFSSSVLYYKDFGALRMSDFGTLLRTALVRRLLIGILPPCSVRDDFCWVFFF